MGDSATQFVLPDCNWGLNYVGLSDAVRDALSLHGPDRMGSIALGRTMVATALLATYQKMQPLSLQISATGRFRQLFADINDEGHMRAYITSDPVVGAPDEASERPSLSIHMSRGDLSVIRMEEGAGFRQSSTPLVRGEVDEDVEYFLATSDQNAAILRSELVFDKDGRIEMAAGILLHALPDADHDARERLSRKVKEDFRGALREAEPVVSLFPSAGRARQVSELRWQCRCSDERVMRALKMLGPTELADMVDKKEAADVRCDFCNTRYTVEPAKVEEIFLDTMVAKNQ